MSMLLVLCSPRNVASACKTFEFFASECNVSWGNAEVLPKHCNIFFPPISYFFFHHYFPLRAPYKFVDKLYNIFYFGTILEISR